MKMKNCIPTILLVCLVNYLKLWFNKVFTHLCLLKRPTLRPARERDHDDYADHFNGYILVTDGRTRSSVLVPLQVVTSTIKNNLRVLKYGDYIERFGYDDREELVLENSRVCTVCLESMEKNDEMRELCNCSHVFHKDCLDDWVNEGRFTCPLCRSTLFSDRIDWNDRARPAWIIN